MPDGLSMLDEKRERRSRTIPSPRNPPRSTPGGSEGSWLSSAFKLDGERVPRRTPTTRRASATARNGQTICVVMSHPSRAHGTGRVPTMTGRTAKPAILPKNSCLGLSCQMRTAPATATGTSRRIQRDPMLASATPARAPSTTQGPIGPIREAAALDMASMCASCTALASTSSRPLIDLSVRDLSRPSRLSPFDCYRGSSNENEVCI